jgi:pyridoxine kinase
VKRGAILSISSQVVRGHVGNSVAAFALQRLGLEVYEVPTLVWNHHPGHGAPKGLVLAAETLEGLLDRFTTAPWNREIGMVVTGYLRDAGQVGVVARSIARLKALDPSLLYVCDPVCGDRAGPYVPTGVIGAIRDELVPLADAMTPNRHELGFISGRATDTNAMIREAAASLAPGVALVSSAHARTSEAAANLLAARGLPTQLIETPLLASAPNGTGDLLTAVFAGRLALGASPSEAAAVAVAAVHDVIRVTADIGHDELAIVEAQANLAVPSTIPAVSVMPD